MPPRAPVKRKPVPTTSVPQEQPSKKTKSAPQLHDNSVESLVALYSATPEQDSVVKPTLFNGEGIQTSLVLTFTDDDGQIGEVRRIRQQSILDTDSTCSELSDSEDECDPEESDEWWNQWDAVSTSYLILYPPATPRSYTSRGRPKAFYGENWQDMLSTYAPTMTSPAERTFLAKMLDRVGGCNSKQVPRTYGHCP